jgi:23S rRNA pseudouridine955/2504/2580 synthase
LAGLRTVTVSDEEAGLRLDRWFRAHYPGFTHGALQKALRTGQVRVDGRRAQAGLRLDGGMEVRVPPQAAAPRNAVGSKAPPPKATLPKVPLRVTRDEAEDLRARVLYRDDTMIAIDKPAGLAVQGGSGTRRHLDAMLDALRFGAAERPRLVHRLDKDTSGVLLLARTRAAARQLTAAFKGHDMRKIYWAITVGCPRPRQGRIDLALSKSGGPGAEKMRADTDGRSAATLYLVMEAAGRRAAFVALMPLTGRTHQLRAHMAAIDTPILGDGKYGGKDAFLEGDGLASRLHLHARSISVPIPAGGVIRIEAPLPPHMAEAFAALGFSEGADPDPFPKT